MEMAPAAALVVNLAATNASQSFRSKAVILQASYQYRQSNNGVNIVLQATRLRDEPEANR